MALEITRNYFIFNIHDSGEELKKTGVAEKTVGYSG